MPMFLRLNKICIPNVSNELVTILDLCMLFLCIFNQFARCFRIFAGSRMRFTFVRRKKASTHTHIPIHTQQPKRNDSKRPKKSDENVKHFIVSTELFRLPLVLLLHARRFCIIKKGGTTLYRIQTLDPVLIMFRRTLYMYGEIIFLSIAVRSIWCNSLLLFLFCVWFWLLFATDGWFLFRPFRRLRFTILNSFHLQSTFWLNDIP